MNLFTQSKSKHLKRLEKNAIKANKIISYKKDFSMS